MSRLESLIATREKASTDLNTLLDAQAVILESRSLTVDEQAAQADAVKRVADVQVMVADEETRESEAKAQLEKRNERLGVNSPGAGTSEPRSGERTKISRITINDEPLTYSKGNPENSFYRDLYFLASPSPGTRGAAERLQKHQSEMDAIRTRFPKGAKESRLLQSYDREAKRGGLSEQRDVSTGTSSMGDFAPPLYFLSQYAPFRTYGRTLISCLKDYPLPETGMVFNVPRVTTPTITGNQTTATQGANENTIVTTRDMTSTYESGSLQTVVDNLLVSQQYLDRVGPGIGGDMIVRDDQTRQMNRELNLYAWGAMLGIAGNGAIADTGTAAFNETVVAEFKHLTHGAKAAIRRTDGTVAYPTHFITDADVWEQVEGAYDTNGRPYVVPQGVAFNPLAVGDNSSTPEGYTGFHFAGLPAFADEAAWVGGGQLDNIVIGAGTSSSATLSTHCAVVGAFDIALYWMEGPPVIRVLPQPYAAQLTVLIQQFTYAALIPIYPAAVQVIYGTQLSDSLITSY